MKRIAILLLAAGCTSLDDAAQHVRIPTEKSAAVAEIAAEWFRSADLNGDGFVDGQELVASVPVLVTRIRVELDR